jgi:hypothetical protein
VALPSARRDCVGAYAAAAAAAAAAASAASRGSASRGSADALIIHERTGDEDDSEGPICSNISRLHLHTRPCRADLWRRAALGQP